MEKYLKQNLDNPLELNYYLENYDRLKYKQKRFVLVERAGKKEYEKKVSFYGECLMKIIDEFKLDIERVVSKIRKMREEI